MTSAIKFGIIAAIFLLGLASGWLVHGWKYDAEQLKAAESLAIARAENERLKDSLREKKDDELKKIADSAASLAAGRVHLPKGCIQTEPASGSQVSVTGTGQLPESPQQALDRFKLGVDELARKSDETVANCRVVMEWAKAQ